MPSFLIPVPSVETCGNVKNLSGLVYIGRAVPMLVEGGYP